MKRKMFSSIFHSDFNSNQESTDNHCSKSLDSASKLVNENQDVSERAIGESSHEDARSSKVVDCTSQNVPLIGLNENYGGNLFKASVPKDDWDAFKSPQVRNFHTRSSKSVNENQDASERAIGHENVRSSKVLDSSSRNVPFISLNENYGGDLFKSSASRNEWDVLKSAPMKNLHITDCSLVSSFKDTRAEIEKVSDQCIDEFLKERKRLTQIFADYQLKNRKNHSELFEKRLKNLDLQNKQFQKFVSDTKTRFMENSTKKNFIYSELSMKTLKREADIFLCFFPSYGLKDTLLKEIEEKRVVVISADCSYHLDVALPFILSNEYEDSTIISAEENEILRTSLQMKMNSVFSSNVGNLSKLELVTAEEMLKKFSSSNLPQSDSLVIYNVPLKRSLVTDMNLSHLRDWLASRGKSKLILLISPHDDVSKFRSYFSSVDTVSELNLPSLSFPVKIIWKEAISSPTDVFCDDVSNTVLSIHVLCGSGDIVAFLPSMKCVKSACDVLDVKMNYHQYNEIKVFCIGDNYNSFLESCNNPSSDRRVFLLISGCEGIISPSSRYVIDCGIHEDYTFDSVTDNNISAPAFISRGRAKIRKQLAGAFNTGMVFRIYNKSNFLQNMSPKEHSELFCCSPVHSTIRVFEHRRKVEFVESLPDDVQKSTLEILKSCGALDDDLCVTYIGQRMVKLNLPVKHSRLIIFGIQCGFAFEAVILVAFFSIRKRLFVESKSEVQQKLIDAVKLEFNQYDSDTLTFLNIFKMWKENSFKKSWCLNHHIDYDVLKNIRSKVNELCHTVEENIGEKIRQDFSDNSDPDDLFQMLFECFQNHLCSYTGHERTGYHLLGLKRYALVHPSSFLYQRDYSRFVVYEDLILSDPSYVRNLTCIPFDIVMKYTQQQKSVLKFSSNEILEDQLVERVIDGVGEKVIKQVFFGKKTKEIENNIRKETRAQVILLEPFLEKGLVNVYAFPDDIDKCVASLNRIIKNCIQAMLKEEEFKVIQFNNGQNSVKFETKWSKGAETVSCRQTLVPLNVAPTKTASVDDGAVNSQQCVQSIHYLIKLVWPRRFCTGEGYLNFKNATDFNQARKCALRYFPVAGWGSDVFVVVSERRSNQLRLSDIPPEVTEQDLKKVFSSYLSCEFEVELCCLAPFRTSTNEILDVKRQIEENCRNETNLRNFDVRVCEPTMSSLSMTAFVHVFETRCLNKEADNLSTTTVNDMKLTCSPLYRSDLKCSVNVYNALVYRIKTDFMNFIQEHIRNEDKQPSFKVEYTGDDSVSIQFSYDDIEIVKALQMKINDLLRGVVLDKNNIKNIHKLFCHGGHVHLKSLESSQNILIVQNFESKTIRLYGDKEKCNFVRQEICYFLDEAEEKTENVGLSSRAVLKALITQYGVNLEKFIELSGLRSASLDIRTSVLILYGRRENIEKAIECLRDLSTASDSSEAICSSLSVEEICPVCACPAENLTIRLEHCGHVYCFGCILALVEQARFPLQCCAENCSKDIILEDIKYVLNHDGEKIEDLAEKSLKAYLEKNREKIFYCPAPDCSMFIYKEELKEDKWNCTLCQNSICTKCNVVYHEGYSCDMYRGSRDDPDYSFKVWQKNKTKDCKICPNCASAIEKRDGCNHMTCSVCHCHFCWLCLKKYPTGDEVYRHIYTAHPNMLYWH